MSTDPLLTVTDIAVMFRRAVGTVESWRLAGDMPEPDIVLGRTPGWHRATLVAWGRATGRLQPDGSALPPGRRPPRRSAAQPAPVG
jgi:hypothetical protein